MLITISGPSGAGKTTLINELSNIFSINSLPSWTTRKRRNDNNENIYYNFLSKQEYAKISDNHEFILEDSVSGNWYGTKKSDLVTVVNDNKIWVADFTTQSVIDLIEKGITPILVTFLYVDRNISVTRMHDRGDDELKIKERSLHYDTEMANIVKLSTYFKSVEFINAEINTTDLAKQLVEGIRKYQ